MLVDGADVRDGRPRRRCAARSASSPTTRSCSPHTLRDNIAYARPDASDEEVEDAAGRAGIHEFIDEPAGRLRHARRRARRDALAAGSASASRSRGRCSLDPRILILDDATSSVDATTEAAIKEALRELMEGRTTFMIAPPPVDDRAGRRDRGARGRRGSRRAAPTTSCSRQSDLYREIAEKGLPDRCFLTRKPASARWRACEASCWRVIRGEERRARKLRGLLSLLRPYRGRVVADVRRAVLATAASLAPPYLAGRAIDDGIRRAGPRRAHA